MTQPNDSRPDWGATLGAPIGTLFTITALRHPKRLACALRVVARAHGIEVDPDVTGHQTRAAHALLAMLPAVEGARGGADELESALLLLGATPDTVASVLDAAATPLTADERRAVLARFGVDEQPPDDAPTRCPGCGREGTYAELDLTATPARCAECRTDGAR